MLSGMSTIDVETARKAIGPWLERDLTEAAQHGELSRAYEVDGMLDRLAELLRGGRYPVLVGDAGVGKTALVHELARRAAEGSAPPGLNELRFLQISLQLRATALKKPQEELGSEFGKLVDALVTLGPDAVVFIRDLHVAYVFDLESRLNLLGFRFPGLVIGEGQPATVQQMFEYTTELEQYYTVVPVHEPDLERARTMLAAWSKEHGREHLGLLSSEALDQTLYLAHRFLPRSRMPRKAIELVRELAETSDEVVLPGEVFDAFCRRHAVPRVLVDPEYVLDPTELETWFASRVLGQQEAVSSIVRMICTIKAALSDVDRPFGAFLFVGPTGVGKTYLASLVAEYLFASRDRMVRINLGDFQSDRAAEALFGDPEGHSIALKRGVLTKRLMGHAFAVLLLDEFEKASRPVHDRFLQLIDEGAFINGAGEVVSCRSTVVVATSNAGADIYRSRSFGFAHTSSIAGLDRELDARLEKWFRVEMLNRFDQIVHFHPLSRRDIRTIARRELGRIARRAGLRQRQIELEIDEAVLDWLAVHGYHPDFGARFLRRCVERSVTTKIAEVLVRDHGRGGDEIRLTVRAGAVVARVVMAEGLAPERAPVQLPEGLTTRRRTLDRAALLAEKATLLERARPRLEGLDGDRQELSAVLQRMNEPGFWDHGADRQTHLEHHRQLEMRVRRHDRLARPILALAEHEDESSPRLAARLETAANALAEWENLEAEEAPASVWMVIRSADPIRPAGELIEKLVEMEVSWCRRLQLEVAVVAYEAHGGDSVERVVLDIEGPGAAAYLSMESGVHRLRRSQEGDLRAIVEIIPKSDGEGVSQQVRELRPRSGRFSLQVSVQTVLRSAERGVEVELLGEEARTLAHVRYDLEAAWAELDSDQPALARSYAEDGAGARDPRTGAVVVRFRDVLRGRLDRLLEAWRARLDSS